jgi:hypothetical protein
VDGWAGGRFSKISKRLPPLDFFGSGDDGHAAFALDLE